MSNYDGYMIRSGLGQIPQKSYVAHIAENVNAGHYRNVSEHSALQLAMNEAALLEISKE